MQHTDQTNSNEIDPSGGRPVGDPSGGRPVGDPSGGRPVGDPEWLARVPLAAWRGWICRGGSWDVGRSTTGRLRWAPVRSGAYVPCAMLQGHGLDVPDGVREVRARPIEVVEETCYSDASTRGYALGLREVAGILGLNTSGPSDGDDRAECDHWRREIRAHVETVSVRERRGVAQAILQRTLSAGDGALRTIETAGAGTIVAVAASAICRRQNEIRRRANVRGRLQGLREACTSFGIDPKRDADPETEIARCQTALGVHAEHVAENVLRDVAERAGLTGPDQTCADIDHCQSAAEHYRREIVSRVKSTYHYGDVLAQRRETACLLLERLGAGDAALMAQIRQATPGDVLRLAEGALAGERDETRTVVAVGTAARRNALVDACEVLGIDTQRVRTAEDAMAVLREYALGASRRALKGVTVRETLADLLRELGVGHDRDEVVNTETVAGAISRCSQVVREWAGAREESARTSGSAAGAREVAVVALPSLGAYDDATGAALREAEGKGFPLVAAVLVERLKKRDAYDEAYRNLRAEYDALRATYETYRADRVHADEQAYDQGRVAVLWDVLETLDVPWVEGEEINATLAKALDRVKRSERSFDAGRSAVLSGVLAAIDLEWVEGADVDEMLKRALDRIVHREPVLTAEALDNHARTVTRAILAGAGLPYTALAMSPGDFFSGDCVEYAIRHIRDALDASPEASYWHFKKIAGFSVVKSDDARPGFSDKRPEGKHQAPEPQVQAFDPVQKPAHYASGAVECIDAIEAALQGDADPVSAFLRGQVIKYVWRMHGKGAPLQDAKKAAWYLERLIRHLDGEPEGGGGSDGGDKIQFNAPEERAAVSTVPEIIADEKHRVSPSDVQREAGAHSAWRGHPITFQDGAWVYADTGAPVREQPDRRCGACDKPNRADGHDACLGEISGVTNACCGHGDAAQAYVQFDDGSRVAGQAAIAFMRATTQAPLNTEVVRMGRIEAVLTSRAGLATTYNRDIRQGVVSAWCARAFGAEHAASVEQRAVRFLEEAVEVYQAAGADRDMARRLIDHVFGKEPGDLAQELGGAGVTLLALSAAAGLSADDCERREVDRIIAIPDKVWAERNRDKGKAGFNVKTKEDLRGEPETLRAYDVWRETDDARTAIRAPNAGAAVEQYCSDAGLSSDDVDSNVDVRVQVPGHHTVGIYRVQNGVVQLVRTVRLARFRRVVQP